MIVFVGLDKGPEPDAEPLPPPEFPINRIAYVSRDGYVRTIRPDGSDEVPVSGREGFFTWPTLSPDGERLLYSAVVEVDPGVPQSVLYRYNGFTGRSVEVHRGEPGVRSLVARDAPHYTYWAPDGEKAAFIGSSGVGLKLFVTALRDEQVPPPKLSGGPMWLSWSPDSTTLLIHIADNHLKLDVGQGSTSSLPLMTDGFGYNVPAWRPGADEFASAVGDLESGYGLGLATADSAVRRIIDRVPPRTAFLWSPNGEHIAVSTAEQVVPLPPPLGLLLHRRVSIFEADGTLIPASIEGNVVAFFWSPDSRTLAYVAVDLDRVLFEWHFLDVATGVSRLAAEFLPSLDQLTMFQFFDQYAPSHSLWAPDSSALVFSGALAGGAVSASTRQPKQDHIFVLGAGPSTTVDSIADGVLAFWSPR